MSKNLLPIILSTVVVVVLCIGGFTLYQSTKSSSQSTSTTSSQSNNINSSSITAQTSISSGSCIVTISGKKYNVDELRQTHPGGDVFKCGTDMTSVYQGQHGTSVLRIQQYLVN